MFRLSLLPVLALTGVMTVSGLAGAMAQGAPRQPLYGRTDTLNDPGRIGPNGALHKRVVAGDFFNFRELIEMDLEPEDIITLTIFTGLPRPAPEATRDHPYPSR